MLGFPASFVLLDALEAFLEKGIAIPQSFEQNMVREYPQALKHFISTSRNSAHVACRVAGMGKWAAACRPIILPHATRIDTLTAVGLGLEEAFEVLAQTIQGAATVINSVSESETVETAVIQAWQDALEPIGSDFVVTARMRQLSTVGATIAEQVVARKRLTRR